jgi:antibiotic biosynthesis monooxygenase (ABM) superfamily enzyme
MANKKSIKTKRVKNKPSKKNISLNKLFKFNKKFDLKKEEKNPIKFKIFKILNSMLFSLIICLGFFILSQITSILFLKLASLISFLISVGFLIYLLAYLISLFFNKIRL